MSFFSPFSKIKQKTKVLYIFVFRINTQILEHHFAFIINIALGSRFKTYIIVVVVSYTSDSRIPHTSLKNAKGAIITNSKQKLCSESFELICVCTLTLRPRIHIYVIYAFIEEMLTILFSNTIIIHTLSK